MFATWQRTKGGKLSLGILETLETLGEEIIDMTFSTLRLAYSYLCLFKDLCLPIL